MMNVGEYTICGCFWLLNDCRFVGSLKKFDG